MCARQAATHVFENLPVCTFFNGKIPYYCQYSLGDLNGRFRCGPKWLPPTAGIHWQHAKTQIVAQRCRPGLPWGHRARGGRHQYGHPRVFARTGFGCMHRMHACIECMHMILVDFFRITAAVSETRSLVGGQDGDWYPGR